MLRRVLSILVAITILATTPIAVSFAEEDETKVYYNEDFTEFESGELVNLSSSLNTSYADKGFEFACGSRTGDYYAISASVRAADDNKFISFNINKYAKSLRQPYLRLVKTEGIDFEKAYMQHLILNLQQPLQALRSLTLVQTRYPLVRRQMNI